MQVAFLKINGAGNDFIVFDNRDGSVELTPQHVQHLCDRHRGIGADGVIEVRKSPRPECVAYMHYLNADGSLAEMCGNGVRCFARFLAENDMLSAKERDAQAFVVDTLAGPRPLTYETNSKGKLIKARVGMGEPTFTPALIPTTLEATRKVLVADASTNTEHLEDAVVQAEVCKDEEDDTNASLQSGSNRQKELGQEEGRCTSLVASRTQRLFGYAISCVNMGNPHAVIFLEDTDAELARSFVAHPESLDLARLGAPLEGNTTLFPQKTNVEFVAVQGDNRITMRVYERGVGETLACGTGACAVAVAAVLQGRADRARPIFIDLPGGTLEAFWGPDNAVLLAGPVEVAFAGVVQLEEYGNQ